MLFLLLTCFVFFSIEFAKTMDAEAGGDQDYNFENDDEVKMLCFVLYNK